MRVLLYNLENNLILKQALAIMNIQCFYIEVKDYDLPIKELFDNKDTGNNIKTFTEEMIIMDEFSDIQLDTLLSSLKTNNIKIMLKAIVTDYNKQWTSLQIRDELIKEYLAFKNQKEKRWT